MKSFKIGPLTVENAFELSQMLKSSTPQYQKFFSPFAFDEDSIIKRLDAVKKDVYIGIWLDDIMVGFLMLCGFDEGYTIPSFGVSIKQEYSGKGLLKMTLQIAVTLCKLMEVCSLMLKVHPDNVFAKKTYEKFGFIPTGLDEKNGNIIYHLAIK